MSAVATAIAAGAAVNYAASENAASAAEGAAASAQAEAARQFNITQDNIAKAVSLANSPQEIRALRQSLAQQKQANQQQAKLFKALDPAVMEASKQALNLLRGEEAKSLAPIRNQRQMQREKLLNRLRETLGPGAETSTAGIQALNQFDMQTDTLLSGAQESSLNNLFNMGQVGATNRSALNAGIGQLSNIGQAFGNIAARRSTAQLGGADVLARSGQNMVDTAGSQFVGQQLRSQAQAQLGASLMEAGLTQLPSLGKGSPAPKPSPQSMPTTGGSYTDFGSFA